MVDFDEKLHKYTNNSGREFISVTTLIGGFKDNFQTNVEAKKCEIRGKENDSYKYSGMTADEIKIKWNKICNEALKKGNKYHSLKELEILYSGQRLNKSLNGSNLLFHGYQKYIDLYELEEGITYPELRIYWNDLEIAGHIDVVKVDYGNIIHIKDYKTNRKPLVKKGYKGKTMNKPLDFLQDCSYIHYSLQLNLYGWVLEQYGYKVGSLEVLHKKFLDDEPIPEEHRIPFISEEKQRKVVKVPITYRPDIIEIMLDERNKESKC